MLSLKLQMILLRLLESLAHLQIKYGIIADISFTKHALFVREAFDNKFELHWIFVVLLLMILVSHRLESSDMLAIEAPNELHASIIIVPVCLAVSYILHRPHLF